MIYGSALPTAVDDQNYGVTQSNTATITISPYLQPDYRYVTITTDSYVKRQAKPGDSVQFSILLQPRIDLSLYRIDKIIFRIPNEFNYGKVKTLDSCSMIGKVTTAVTLCALTRV